MGEGSSAKIIGNAMRIALGHLFHQKSIDQMNPVALG
jgi:hypothetical protein